MRWPGKSPARPLLTKLWCAPGNAGIAREAECVALDIADHAAVIAFCKTNKVDLVVVGPEAPLAAGIVDDLAAAGIKAFGPSKAAAQLESSKGFTKDLCRANGIPTARLRALQRCRGGEELYPRAGRADRHQGRRACRRQGRRRRDDARRGAAAVDMMFGGGFGAAGAQVVVEEFMQWRGGVVLRAVRRRARAGAGDGAGPQACRSTATRGRTPAAWAPIRRRP